MKPADRIKQYQKALDFYEKYPTGKRIEIGFLGICDIVYRDKKGKDIPKLNLPELEAVEPASHGLFWWAESPSGVKTRIKKLKIMIKEAKKATT